MYLVDLDNIIEATTINELSEHYKLHKEEQYTAHHPEDRKNSKKLCKALKRVLKYYGENV